MIKTTRYKGKELVNKRAGVELVNYTTRCRWCAALLEGVAFQSAIPLYCSRTHNKKWQEASDAARANRPTTRAVDSNRYASCRRCGTKFWTQSHQQSIVCSVTCLLKADNLDRYTRCWRKVPQITRKKAIEEAWRFGNEIGDHTLQPYHCIADPENGIYSGCGFWHIGHTQQADAPLKTLEDFRGTG